MTDAPGRVRQRSRWLFAAMATLAFVAWWHWPVADSRLVGRWEAWNNSTAATQPVCIIELKSNGRGRTTFPDGSAPDDFAWSVDGDRFNTSLLSGAVWQMIVRQLFARLWLKLGGAQHVMGVHELKIEQVSTDEIRLRSFDGDPIIYRRVAK